MGTAIADEVEAAEVVEALDETRERTLALVESVSDDDLEKVHSTLMSPLVWDLGHIAAFEDLWLVHRFGGKPLLHDELADVYDAFETPRAGRGDLPFLRPSEAREYLAQTRERTLETIAERGVSDVHEMVIRHEQQHNETMLQTIQLARLEYYKLGTTVSAQPRNGSRDNTSTGLELVEIPAGRCTIGAGAAGFAYDNERPRHQTDVREYLIGRTPITNASYLTFVEGGGYERREWWSDEGWAWKEEYDITRPAGWTADLGSEWRLDSYQPLDPNRPVVHVSWFEADAFARAHGARLPTEIEWEKAATWDQQTSMARAFPLGDEPITPGVHANVDHTSVGPQPVGTRPGAASAYGIHDLIGDVWEWTSTDFIGYEGFTAYPYREYSEVFFGSAYKALRGGSWATRARTITPTFRNWDYPLRRQIFAGFRIAKEVQA
ncbi:MAG TPA: ergothioneine biosynthesis protein EgtB [Solirubrobacteraceae bacterium]|nr:ergothioneine biosynthesis protein EgtB [Solirubrobacteraceae bacterium]